MYSLKQITATSKDIALIQTLCSESDVLDKHSAYSLFIAIYLYNNSYFLYSDVNDSLPIGYITSLYTKDSTFIWQIYIKPKYRGYKLSHMLIEAVIQNSSSDNYMVSISPMNTISYNAFRGYATRHNMSMKKVDQLNIFEYSTPSIIETEDIYVLSRL